MLTPLPGWWFCGRVLLWKGWLILHKKKKKLICFLRACKLVNNDFLCSFFSIFFSNLYWNRYKLPMQSISKVSFLSFFLKGTWGQSNNFCLKLSFLFIKQNGINQDFQKFTCKPQLAYYVCSFACMTSLTSGHNSIIQ